MFPRFEGTIKKIIESQGHIVEDFLKENNSITIDKKGFFKFSIEIVGQMLFVGFYRKEGGDTISDPVFVFQIKDLVWYPIRVEQWCGDTVVGELGADEKYRYYPSRFKSVKSFATNCAREWKEYFL